MTLQQGFGSLGTGLVKWGRTLTLMVSRNLFPYIGKDIRLLEPNVNELDIVVKFTEKLLVPASGFH